MNITNIKTILSIALFGITHSSFSQVESSDIYKLPNHFSATSSYCFAEGKGFKGELHRSGSLIRMSNEMGGGFLVLNLAEKVVSVVNDAQRSVIKFKFESSPTTSKIIDDGFLLFGVPLIVDAVTQEGQRDRFLLGGEYKNYTLTVDKATKLPVSLVRVDRDGFWTAVIWDKITMEEPDPNLFIIPSDYSVIEK